MKTLAAVLRRMGCPKPYAVSRPLSVEEVTLAPPGPGEVIVEVAAAGICHSDLSVVDGNRPRPMPMLLGHEASGSVVEVGPHVHTVRPGDHVVFSYVPRCGECEFCLGGRPALCEPGNRANVSGTLLGGAIRITDGAGEPVHHHLGVSGFSRFTVASERSLVKIDPAVPLERAAIFGCAVLTGVGAVFNTARVAPGRSVAVFGLGGVGLNAIIAARAAGAWPVIAVDVNPRKLEIARELGATHALNAREVDPVEAVRDLTHGGAHYTFEAVGNASVWRQVYAAARRGGEAVAIGLAPPQAEYAVPAVGLVVDEKCVRGSYMGSAVPQRDIPRFLAMNMAGLLPVEKTVTHTIRLQQINEAFDALDQGLAVRQLVTMGE